MKLLGLFEGVECLQRRASHLGYDVIVGPVNCRIEELPKSVTYFVSKDDAIIMATETVHHVEAFVELMEYVHECNALANAMQQ